MSSLDGLKESHLISCDSTDFGQFWLPRSTFKVDFLNVQAKFQKTLFCFVGKIVRNIVLNFELSISAGLRGGRFASRHFPKSVILTSFIFVGRPFLACYACSTVIVLFSQEKSF